MPTFGPSAIRAVTDHLPQLEQVLHVVHDVLGAEVAGVCLHGSAVLGGLRPDSDLDVFVVARRRATDRERRNLLDGEMREVRAHVDLVVRAIEQLAARDRH